LFYSCLRAEYSFFLFFSFIGPILGDLSESGLSAGGGGVMGRGICVPRSHLSNQLLSFFQIM